MGAQTSLRARLEAPVIGYRALENTGNTTSVPGRTNARTELEMDARRQESGRVHEFTLINGTLAARHGRAKGTTATHHVDENLQTVMPKKGRQTLKSADRTLPLIRSSRKEKSKPR